MRTGPCGRGWDFHELILKKSTLSLAPAPPASLRAALPPGKPLTEEPRFQGIPPGRGSDFQAESSSSSAGTSGLTCSSLGGGAGRWGCKYQGVSLVNSMPWCSRRSVRAISSDIFPSLSISKFSSCPKSVTPGPLYMKRPGRCRASLISWVARSAVRYHPGFPQDGQGQRTVLCRSIPPWAA